MAFCTHSSRSAVPSRPTWRVQSPAAQIAGLARPTDTIVQRGDPASRKFAVFHLRGGVVAAVEAVNAAPEYLVGKKLIADGVKIAPERLADLSVPMKQMAA